MFWYFLGIRLCLKQFLTGQSLFLPCPSLLHLAHLGVSLDLDWCWIKAAGDNLSILGIYRDLMGSIGYAKRLWKTHGFSQTILYTSGGPSTSMPVYRMGPSDKSKLTIETHPFVDEQMEQDKREGNFCCQGRLLKGNTVCKPFLSKPSDSTPKIWSPKRNLQVEASIHAYSPSA